MKRASRLPSAHFRSTTKVWCLLIQLQLQPLFNEFGDVREDMTFAQLADFVVRGDGRGLYGKQTPYAIEV